MSAPAEKVAPWAPWDDAEACISSLRQMLAQERAKLESSRASVCTARQDGARLRQMAIVSRLRALAELRPDAAAVRGLAERLEQEAGR